MNNETLWKLTDHQIDILSREIGSRVHYGIKVYCPSLSEEPKTVTGVNYSYGPTGPDVSLDGGLHYRHVSLVRPYLRPLSDMTDAEWSELDEKIIAAGGIGYIPQYNETTVIVWLDFMLSHHFDYRGLIDMGLAIKAPKGMYYETLSDNSGD